MKILSHRGFWKEENDKNSMEALLLSIKTNYGLETDLRDLNGEIVISHDIASEGSITLKQFLMKGYDLLKTKNLTLALNIKADGLLDKLNSILLDYERLNYFVFDMSIPDTLPYLDKKIPFFTRVSELESPIFLDQAEGIWLDSFFSDWYDQKLVKDFVDMGKKVCIVSPELHNRSHFDQWNNLKKLEDTDSIFLCTDYPDQASMYFMEQ